MSGVGVDMDALFCQHHYGMMRARRLPLIVVSVNMISKLLCEGWFVDRCGAQTEKIQAEIQKIRPVCCHFGDDKFVSILEAVENDKRKKDSDRAAAGEGAMVQHTGLLCPEKAGL